MLRGLHRCRGGGGGHYTHALDLPPDAAQEQLLLGFVR